MRCHLSYRCSRRNSLCSLGFFTNLPCFFVDKFHVLYLKRRFAFILIIHFFFDSIENVCAEFSLHSLLLNVGWMDRRKWTPNTRVFLFHLWYIFLVQLSSHDQRYDRLATVFIRFNSSVKYQPSAASQPASSQSALFSLVRLYFVFILFCCFPLALCLASFSCSIFLLGTILMVEFHLCTVVCCILVCR